MNTYFHSVRLLPDRCKGCVNCIKRCPTEAIRIRGGKARIIEARCIDCGECIRRCSSHAKSAVTDSIEDLPRFSYNIALPAPTLYAQFGADTPLESILYGLKRLGFDAVFEVARGADFVSRAIGGYLRQGGCCLPAISSACPAVVRLIQVKFPELIEHLVPFAAPAEVAAKLARELAKRETGLAAADIGAWFLTPCPAKMTAVKQPLGSEQSHLSGAIAISKIYSDLLKVLPCEPAAAICSRASPLGVGWAVSGGEALAVAPVQTLVVDGIHRVSEILEQIALGKLKHAGYIEALACAGGCIGGPLTVENRYVAEDRMLRRAQGWQPSGDDALLESVYREIAADARAAIEPQPAMRMDADILQAISKVELMEMLLERLPGLDCGACGSPGCKALAEDIAQGIASETDCVFKLREKVRDLAQEMVGLAGKLPPSLTKL
ncbi:MAG: [Fe-Fe] hydrogenase large subunit C-terminal domain-containing protein [Sporomusaceae bacterium]|nr:[Fe-Fe] hydrogenase large subunit C-terminal domain-containing protein [Sporomusaceae bacterium]